MLKIVCVMKKYWLKKQVWHFCYFYDSVIAGAEFIVLYCSSSGYSTVHHKINICFVAMMFLVSTHCVLLFISGHSKVWKGILLHEQQATLC